MAETIRKLDIDIAAQDEEKQKQITEFEQKTLIWEHREADLERSLENLRKQIQMIENLANNVSKCYVI